MTSVDNIADELARVAAELTAGEHRLIRLIGDFDEAGGWLEQGALTPAQWLSYRIGLSPGPAREKVRVARAIRKLPAVDEAFRVGVLSYSKVRAITRVATPENEAGLVEMAKCATAAQMERVCRTFAGVVRSQGTTSVEEADSKRFVRAVWQDDATLRMTIQVPADEGVRLLAAIDAAREEVSTDEDSATRADGVMVVAESFLAEGARPRRGGAPHEVMLNVSAGTTGDEIAFIDNAEGIGVSEETSRRLCCDASVTKVVRSESGDVLDIGRKSRVVPAAMRRALEARDKGCCTFAGCDHRLYLDAHHIEHWADGGQTKLSNILLLCRRHHTYVHEHGYTVERGETGITFTAPNKTPYKPPSAPNPIEDALAAVAARNHAAGVQIDELTTMAEWDGEPIDYGAVIDCLVAESPSLFGRPTASAD